MDEWECVGATATPSEVKTDSTLTEKKNINEMLRPFMDVLCQCKYELTWSNRHPSLFLVVNILKHMQKPPKVKCELILTVFSHWVQNSASESERPKLREWITKEVGHYITHLISVAPNLFYFSTWQKFIHFASCQFSDK